MARFYRKAWDGVWYAPGVPMVRRRRPFLSWLVPIAIGALAWALRAAGKGA